MKLFKRLFSYLIAFTMVLSLATLAGVNVHADDTTNTTQSYTLTIKGTVAGHEYAVYKVLGGALSGKTLSNVNWGNGVNSSELLSALKDDSAFGKGEANIFYKAKVARDVAEALAKKNDESVEAKAFAQDVGQNLGTPVTFGEGENQKNYVKSTAGNTTITLTDPGYYFVKDNSAVTGHDAKTRFIVQVVGPAEVTVKSSVPTVEKKVKDVNDSEATSTTNPTNWQDSADYDIYDWVPYQITGTMPSNIGDYTSYKYIFTDIMSKGLTYDKDSAKHKAVIKIDGKDVTSAFTQNIEPVTKTDEATGKTEATGETKVTWSINDIKSITDPNDSTKNITITPDTKVVVTYDAQLNDNAVIGSTGNPNTVDLTYSNNPNKDSKGETGKTPEDKNIVFTYAAKFNKVDGSNKPLADAKFTLYKFTTKKIAESDVADTHNNVSGYWHSFGEKEATQQSDGKYTAYYKGLDDGIYKLSETHTPAGYNTMADKIFTVTATHNDGDKPSFGKLTITDLTTTIDDGTFTSDIVNNSGSILPSTGGMGTTLLYVAGGILVACAAAYVVLNKKRA